MSDRLSAAAAAEAYVGLPRPLFTRLPFDYRRIPEGLRSRFLAAATAFARKAPPFPMWPIEETIDVAPSGLDYSGHRFALVLTHDIDSLAELDLIEPIRAHERSLGLSTSWGFVPEGSWPSAGLAESLVDEGCQVYWHDLTHDGRIPWMPAAELRARIDAIDKRFPWARAITTFRSGQLLMSGPLMDAIAGRFRIDMSIPDSERGGPYGSVVGCGSVVPFRFRGLLELPMSMPQDYYLERVMGLDAGSIFDLWTAKIEHIARVGGVAVLNAHPVWINPVHQPRSAMWSMYRKFLEVTTSRHDVLVSTPDGIESIVARHVGKGRGESPAVLEHA